MPVVEPNSESCVGKSVFNDPFHFDTVFFCHGALNVMLRDT
jgi:hypothetical protein